MFDFEANFHPLKSLLKGGRVHFLDVPLYGNIGDLFIFQGTMKFLKTCDCEVVSYSTYYSFDETSVCDGDIFLFQGGGNFGDLYSGPQNLRRKIIQKFPNNRIIILPQTIYYSNEYVRRNDFKIFGFHPDLHIFARDQISYSQLFEHNLNAYLCPDMAVHLYNTLKLNRSHNVAGTLFLSRTDSEKIIDDQNIRMSIQTDLDTYDWDVVIGYWEYLFIGVSIFFKIFKNKYSSQLLSFALRKYWISGSWKLCTSAVNLISRYQYVVTDRLHGAIICELIEKEVQVFDNSYGKISSYFNEWSAIKVDDVGR